MKKNILIKSGIILGIVIIVLAANLLMDNTKISDTLLSVEYPSMPQILSEKTLLQDINKKYGIITDKKRKDIDVKEVKQWLEEKDFVEKATVSLSLTGVLHIDIVQRTVVARVYTKNKKQYYIDKNKYIIQSENQPVPAKTIIVGGDVREIPMNRIDSIKNPQSMRIWELSSMLYNDKILQTWISAIEIKGNTWYLIPSSGDYTIVLGESADWKEELKKLHYLYKESFAKNGWEDYTSIDLRFHNQAICTKK